MNAHERSLNLTHQQCFITENWLTCRFGWWLNQQDAQYVRLAKQVPSLWCVKREDQAKLRKAGQPFKFAHQPPDLKIIQRDAHARVCQMLCRIWRQLINNEGGTKSAASVLATLESLCAALEEVATPYMAVKRNEMDPDAWLRQRTRGRVYANAAKDLRKLLADYAARGGEPAWSSNRRLHTWCAPLAFNLQGEILDRQEPTS